MASLADIYLATTKEAAIYPSSPRAFERMELKGLTPLELSMLRAIVLKHEWEVSDMETFDLIGDESGPEWIFSFPDDFVLALSSLGDERIKGVSGSWAETEELVCDAAEIEQVVVGLVRLAVKARQTGLGLFLWMSL